MGTKEQDFIQTNLDDYMFNMVKDGLKEIEKVKEKFEHILTYFASKQVCVKNDEKKQDIVEPDFKISESNENVAEGENMPLKFKNGSVRYREDYKIYEFRYRINGQTKSLYAKTQEMLKEKYYLIFTKQGILKELSAPKSSNLTFGTWLDEWYEVYKQPKLKESSLFQIRNVIKNHIPEDIKKTMLNKLSALDIQKSLNNNPSTRMAKYALNVYTDALGWAFKLGKIKTDIGSMLQPIKHISEEGKALSVEERKTIETISWTSPEFYIFIFYLYTGCRPSEALTVSWSDVDFENGTIHIHGTKTLTSDRTVPMFEPVRRLLEQIHKDKGYIFDFKYKALDRRRKNLQKISNIEFETKDLRTTFATRLEEEAISKNLIKKWLGHTSERTTNNYYIKVLPEFERKEADKINLKFN